MVVTGKSSHLSTYLKVQGTERGGSIIGGFNLAQQAFFTFFHSILFVKSIRYVKASVSPPGLGFVWECQGISVSPFYLCESCKEIIIHYNICEHMRSYDHQLQYIVSEKWIQNIFKMEVLPPHFNMICMCFQWMQHPNFLYFWDLDFLLEEMKQDIVEDIAMMLSKRERYYKVDAQVTSSCFMHVIYISMR